jgi:GT2 family glycosyltransferase
MPVDPRPLVSVVVPTYQRVALLEEALRSALAQTYERLELLVEDDGSTDGSERMVASLGDPRLSYAWAPNTGYPAPVRNRAIRRAKGALVAFLDSDDVWEPHKLARQVPRLLADPTLLAVSSRASAIPPSHRRLTLVPDKRPTFHEALSAGGGILNSGTVVRREVFDAVGLLDEDRALRAVEDLDLWLRILRHRDRSILVLAERLFRYRTSDDSISPAAEEARQELVRRVLAKHVDAAPEIVRAALAHRDLLRRRAELLEAYRAGRLPVLEWLRAAEVPLRRRVRVAARAALLGRAKA